MSNPSTPPETPVLTPCIGTCRLDARGLCVGCLRTGEEIGGWRAMSDTQRIHIMEIVLPKRRSS